MTRPRAAAIVLAALLLSACKPPEDSRMTAIVGAVLIDGTGGAPMSHSVVLVAGSRIHLVGPQGSTPIPAGSEKINGAGRFVVPALVPVAESSGLERATTLAETRRLVDGGARAISGMIADTEDIPAELATRMRNLQFVFVPRLADLEIEVARRNTRRLTAAGVPIALAADAGTRGLELLADAGLSPMDVVVSATRYGGLAQGRKDEAGVIAPGRPADLVILSANPLEDVRHLTRAERSMRAGRWVDVR